MAAASAPAQIGRNVLANRSQRPTADDSGDVIPRLAFAACFGSRCDRGLAFLRWAVWRGIASANRGSACRRVAPRCDPHGRRSAKLVSTRRRYPPNRVRADAFLESRQSSLLVAYVMVVAPPERGVGDDLLFGRTGGNERCNSSKRRASSSLPCRRNQWIASP